MRKNKKNIYAIVVTNHGRRQYTLYSHSNEEKIFKKFNNILKENKKVIFPMKYNNEQHVMIPSEHEIFIVKCKEENDKNSTKLRDDSGKYINYESAENNWIIIERASFNVEETFFVYGYHPRLQRKTFEWIFNEFISKNAKSKYFFKTVQIYLNKVLIDCNGKLDMVICKNKDDAIRFYNKIEEFCKLKKHKYVLFMGDVGKSKYKKQWIERIEELTHWPRLKILRSSTRP